MFPVCPYVLVNFEPCCSYKVCSYIKNVNIFDKNSKCLDVREQLEWNMDQIKERACLQHLPQSTKLGSQNRHSP